MIFDQCCFEKVKKGSLVKDWLELCDFLNTSFKNFNDMLLIETAMVDSKFSKFNKSIEVKREFFFIDIFYTIETE